MLLANELSKHSPARAAQLFERCKLLNPAFDLRSSWADIGFARLMLWRSARNTELDRIRFADLNRARSDHDLAMSILAAHLADQLPLLEEYIAKMLSSKFPSEIARAIMVIGFLDKSPKNDDRLAKFQGKKGLIGKAFCASNYAYERNTWARHWYPLACQSECNEDFWCNTVLLSKVVDGRFELWSGQHSEISSPINQFRSSFENQIKSRIKKWEFKRKSKLFGQDLPDEIFFPE